MLLSCFILAGPALAQDTFRFSAEGITFDYPKDWKVKTVKTGSQER